ncbi:MAG TPA: type 2 lanthipeptide synthetase LanM family protein [Pseudonocardiaceae bacterium]|nr:type 2 lanthipeptide synthetase LanM family protein [Pseudonocardiaceae bacterium]
MLTDLSSWYRALSLVERLPCGPSESAADERAARRLDRWRRQPPFDHDRWLATRLAADGITDAELGDLLAEDDQSLCDRQPEPGWLADMAAFGAPAPFDEPTGFVDLAEPLLRRARSEVRMATAELAAAGGPLDPVTAGELLWESVRPGLIGILERTLALELNVSRLRGELTGTTAAQRFRGFLLRLREAGPATALFEEYPVLGRLLTEHVRRRTAVHVEFLTRLTADWPAIRARFGPATDPGVLTALQANVSDRHRGGRAVLIAHFTSGWKLVHKPKSLAVDEHYRQLIDWLNARVTGLGLRGLRVLDRGEYGWTEFCAHAPCDTPEQVALFYRRLGGQLALMYTLGGTDLHNENLIAAGADPLVVDLESLFQPDLPTSADAWSSDVTERMSLDSVRRVGLLPQRTWGHDAAPGIDMSGLGYQEEQLSPRASQYWDGVGTDRMRLRRKRMRTSGGHNRPSLRGAEVTVLDHAEDFVGGFRDAYLGVRDHRAELLTPDGPLAWFAGDEVRTLLRPTHIYSLLLRESFHPDLLRDGLDRDRFFDKLWVSVHDFPYLDRVVGAERADLWNGDIPMFVTRPGSRDIWTSRGEPVPEFVERSGLDLAHARIARLSENDLEWQTWIIRGSFAALSIGDGVTATPHRPAPRVPRPESGGDFLAAARAVGDRLERLSIRHGDGLSWLGLTAFRERCWDLTALGVDLYGGLSGISLFLGYLGATTGEPRYTELAESALVTVRRMIDQPLSHPPQVGAFSGWGGVVYLLTRLGVLWDRADLLDSAVVLAERVSEWVDEDSQFDVLAGSAGFALAVAGLYRHRPEPELVKTLLRCGDRLLSGATSVGSAGLGWVTPLGSAPLSGFGHGSAGIALSLAGIGEITGQGRFSDAAVGAVAHERGLFLPGEENWDDLRDERSGSLMSAWCHGAVGVGLGRALLPSGLVDSGPELDVAMSTALASGLGVNHSLCHGDLGVVELLLVGGHGEAVRVAGAVLADIERGGWRCGVPTGVETPGLMAGLAGIGYGLLRVADPAGVPSVLGMGLAPARR